MVKQKQNSMAKKLLMVLVSVVMVLGLSATLAPRAFADDGANNGLSVDFGNCGSGSLLNMGCELLVTIQPKADANVTVTFNKPTNVTKM